MPWTVPEIEEACIAGQQMDFSRHSLSPPEPSHSKTFYPHGFPVKVLCDTPVIFQLMGDMWRHRFERLDMSTIRCEVYVSSSPPAPCPPPPLYRLQMPYLFSTVDANNFCVTDLQRGTVRINVTEGVLQHRLYTSSFLLSAPLACIATKHATPVHAACVSWKGHGMLLCGDSGAGKSTLAYACARAGWTYTADDACYMVHNGHPGRPVLGNCHQVRFRPETAQLFPELNDLMMTPRAAGKPSAELSLDHHPHIRTKAVAQIESILFLCRDHEGPATLEPYRTDVARYAMRQTVFGTARMLRTHYTLIDRLLQAPVYRLRYRCLNEAIALLRHQAEEGARGIDFAAAD